MHTLVKPDLTNSSLKDEEKINTPVSLKRQQSQKLSNLHIYFRRLKTIKTMWEGLFQLYPKTENPVSLKFTK